MLIKDMISLERMQWTTSFVSCALVVQKNLIWIKLMIGMSTWNERLAEPYELGADLEAGNDEPCHLK